MALLAFVGFPTSLVVWAYSGSTWVLLAVGLFGTWLACAAYVVVFAPWVPGPRPSPPASPASDNSGATVQP